MWGRALRTTIISALLLLLLVQECDSYDQRHMFDEWTPGRMHRRAWPT